MALERTLVTVEITIERPILKSRPKQSQDIGKPGGKNRRGTSAR
jgi:hypothetical protein